MSKRTSKAKQAVVTNNEADSLRIELENLQGKSAKIRYLDSIGYDRKKIKDYLNETFGYKLRYQHVRNVLVTQLKKDMNK